MLLSCTGFVHAAETVCNDNGGAGWAIPDPSTTNLTIPFQFGDVSTAFDVDVSVDITKVYVGDLAARATSPQGTTVLLFERPGTALAEFVNGPPYGCAQSDMQVTFDDEAAVGTNVENVCNAGSPAIAGTYLPHNAAPNNLSAIDGENPNGDWAFQLTHSEPFDPGTLNEVCITAAFAGVTFDKWVSTNATCTDTIDTLSVATGTNVYYCYTASNPSTETFTINGGDATDDQGHDLTGLETSYAQGASQTVIVGPLLAGTDVAAGTTVNNAQVTATFATANYNGTLVTGETATLDVGDPVINTSTKTVVDLNGGGAEPGDVLEYTVTINETGGFYTPDVTLDDVVDANLNTVTVTSVPPGSTATTIGNNISVVDITLPANGSVTLVYEATIALATPAGTNINNTATINHAGSGVSFDALAPAVIVSAPDISTSTKTVLDVDGGSALPGDLLRYTITIIETAGNPATNVQLIDVIDPNLTGLTVTSIPAGAVDNTSGSTIDISNISIAANGSATVIFEANINAATAIGIPINNTANITDVPTGANASPIAPTIIVSGPVTSGVKQLYLDALNGTPDLTRVIPAVNTNTANFGVGSSITANQAITFQAPFTITGGSTINVQLHLRRRSGGGSRTVQVELFNAGTGTSIGTNTQTWNAGGWQFITFPITIAADANFAVGDYVRLVVTNAAGGNVQMGTLRNGQNSQVQMQSSTVINVDSVGVYSAAYPSTTQFTSYSPGSTIYIRATVSDPFGNADITGSTITITDPTPAVQVNNVPMTSVATPTGDTRIYEYQYTLPFTPEGLWTASVTANEGTEGTVSHTSQAVIIVGTPTLLVSKNSQVISDPINVTNPKAIPESVTEYTLSVTNSGYGYADNNTIVISDPVAIGTTLYLGSPADPAQFTDGLTASGLSYTFTSLASTTDDIDFSNNGGASFITPTVDGSGFDATVPPINFIRITPKGAFRGSDGTNDPSFSIKWRVKVN